MSNSTATPRRSRIGTVTQMLALALFAAMFALLPTATHADSTATYDISGTLASGGTFNGVLEFDQNGSTLELINSSFTLDGNSYGCAGLSSNNCSVFDAVPFSWVTIQGSSSLVVFQWLNSGFDFSNPPSSFNFIGGYCLGCGPGLDFLTSGQATIASTPEPASLLLLAAGILALGLLSRRQLHASSQVA
jgi:hypothetical protein